MDAKLILWLAAFAVAACAALAWLLGRGRRGGNMIAQPQIMPPMEGSFGGGREKPVSVELGRRLSGMLERGEREEAVRLVRESAGMTEAKAREVVEMLDRLRGRLES